MMGTALLLIMVGLLVHPADAAEPGDIPTVGLGNVTVDIGPVPGYSDTSSMTGITGPFHSTTHPYE
jgi:hypothetical protein